MKVSARLAGTAIRFFLGSNAKSPIQLWVSGQSEKHRPWLVLIPAPIGETHRFGPSINCAAGPHYRLSIYYVSAASVLGAIIPALEHRNPSEL